MIQLLSRLFIKDYKNTAMPRVRQAYGILSGAVGIFLNLVLFAGKFAAGMLSGSLPSRPMPSTTSRTPVPLSSP